MTGVTNKKLEERVTESGGTKHDQDKVRLDLIPEELLLGIGKVLTFGAKKYGDHNWRGGLKFSRVYGALLRHLTAWHKGEDIDPESSMPHLSHAGCCLAFLMTYTTDKEYSKYDDRWKSPKDN